MKKERDTPQSRPQLKTALRHALEDIVSNEQVTMPMAYLHGYLEHRWPELADLFLRAHDATRKRA